MNRRHIWLEIDNHNNMNMLCGVIYRHPRNANSVQ